MPDNSYPYKSNQDFIIELHQIASALSYAITQQHKVSHAASKTFGK